MDRSSFWSMQKRFGAEKVFFRLDITDLTDECSGQWEINAPINVNPVGGGGGGGAGKGRAFDA